MRCLALLVLAACAPDVAVIKQTTDLDSDGYAAEIDCDDTHATVNPDALEVCDGLDNDCDGSVDESPTDGDAWFADVDSDGAGDAASSQVACDAPAGFVADDSDCDDNESRAYPSNSEVCDGIDNDCDGAVDDAPTDASTFYADGDEDGYGDASLPTEGCEAPAGYVAGDADCDDGDAAIHPDATEADCSDPTDYNCDGSVSYADADRDGSPACEDCDDTDATRSPSWTEVCDAADVDEDCDGAADDADEDPSGTTSWSRDRDADGYGDPATAVIEACEQPAGYVADATDCDDFDAVANPAGSEVCDPLDVDEDCDGLSDDADPSVSAASWSTWYRDGDGDAHGDPVRPVSQCESIAGYVASSDDCDDGDPAVSPDATEVCDGSTDEDCDDLVDDDDSSVDTSGYSTGYADDDGDTWGDGTDAASACVLPAGYVSNAGDCDDASAAINPGEAEVCDSADTDEDCDGLADDADPSVAASGYATSYRDDDGDGYGDDAASACDFSAGYVAVGGDCDDASSSVNPGATEICDAADTDEDCDGLADDDDPSVGGATTSYADGDSDGYGAGPPVSSCDAPSTGSLVDTDCDDGDGAVHPGASESCNATDDDCDGAVDDDDSCPCEVVEDAGQAYMFCTDGAAWADAEADCESFGYSLATINDADENSTLQSIAIARDSTRDWWIGFNDLDTEGTFVWVDGDAVGFTAWRSGQPDNNNGIEDCATIIFAGGAAWNDRSCGDPEPYICESP